MFCVGFRLLLSTLRAFTSLKAGASRPLCPSQGLHRADRGTWCYPRDHLDPSEPSGRLFVPEGGSPTGETGL